MMATRYAAQATSPPEAMQPIRARMAELYRGIERRHLAAARLHTMHAARLRTWYRKADGRTVRPALISVVAEALHMDGATLSLLDGRWTHAMVATANTTSRVVHELELLYGEGPASEAVTGREVVAAGAGELCDRWPFYGPAAAELGVHSVVAAPLCSSTVCLGSLSAFSGEPALLRRIPSTVVGIADALTHSVLLPADRPATDEDEPERAALPAGLDDQAVVHQATGMISAQCRCDIGTARALLTARAFSDGLALEETARQVVHRKLLLGDG
jgi:hypothetical protein